MNELLPLIMVRCRAVPSLYQPLPGYLARRGTVEEIPEVKSPFAAALEAHLAARNIVAATADPDWVRCQLAPEAGELYYASKAFVHSLIWQFWRVSDGCPDSPRTHAAQIEARRPPCFTVNEAMFDACFVILPNEARRLKQIREASNG